MLIAKNVNKRIRCGSEELTIVNNINIKTVEGEMLAISGHSGSGKSTLLGILSGIDCPNEGEVWCNGVNLYNLKENELSQFRNKNFGIVFQNYYLIKELSAIENVQVPQLLSTKKNNKNRNPAELLDLVGLNHKMNTRIANLSGGEQQRVSIARALIQEPQIIFADEPTGALDYESSKMVMELFLKIKNDFKVNIILVTHDNEIAKMADRRIILNYGKIQQESKEKS